MHVIGGAQTYSKAPARYPKGTPRYASAGVGAYVHTEDGRWLDTVNALGAVTLGHHHPAVIDAVRQQLDRGVAFSLPTELEQQAADELEGIVPPYVDAVRYAKNGADVTGAAVRLARAITGREVVLMSETGYHGHHEWCMTRPPKNGGVTEGMTGLTHFYRHGDLDSLQEKLMGLAKKGWRAAAVVVEPIESGSPREPSLEWWANLKPLCESHGAMLIFDEVVTGLRVPEFTFANWIHNRGYGGPDLLCLGKGIANGHPLSVLAGPREYLERINGDVFFSTTHGGEALSLAAARATLSEAKRVYLPEVLEKAGARFWAAAHGVAVRKGIDVECPGYLARPFLKFADPLVVARAVAQGMAKRRVLWQGYVNMSYALADPRVLVTLNEKIKAALEEAC